MSSQPEEQSTEILKWLQKYREDRQNMLQQQTMSPSPNASRKTPKRSSSSIKSNDENKKRVFLSTPSGVRAQENHDTPTNEMIAISPSKAARKGLMCVMDMNAGAGSMQISTPLQPTTETDLASIMGSPISANKPKHCRPKVILWKEPIDDVDDDPLEIGSTSELRVNHQMTEVVQEPAASASPIKKSFNPKKKWLRDAWQEDLGASPLDYGASHPLYKNNPSSNWQMGSTSNDSSSDSQANPNQNRPSVLIMGPTLKDKTTF